MPSMPTRPGAIARAAAELSAPVVYLSTDYVFDGEKDGYYDEDGSSRARSTPTAARRSRARSRSVPAIRGTSSCEHPGSTAPTVRNFLRSMLKLAADARGRARRRRPARLPNGGERPRGSDRKTLPALSERRAPFGTYHLAGALGDELARLRRSNIRRAGGARLQTARVTCQSRQPTIRRRRGGR